MGWLDYYWLLKKYDGNLSAATPQELEAAARANPNDPESARRIAQEAYERQRACPPGGSRRGDRSAHGGRGEQGTPHITACTPRYLELPAEAVACPAPHRRRPCSPATAPPQSPRNGPGRVPR